VKYAPKSSFNFVVVENGRTEKIVVCPKCLELVHEDSKLLSVTTERCSICRGNNNGQSD
jgi:ribosomal protein L28